jgi:hypothetical protein
MFDPNPPHSSAPVACNPHAIEKNERARWLEVGRKVYGNVVELNELPDGFACRLPGNTEMLLDVAEYVSRDRRCCEFLRWTLRVEPELGAVWLTMTGSASAKALLRETFETTDMVPLPVAQRAGLNVTMRAAVGDGDVEAVVSRVNQAARR